MIRRALLPFFLVALCLAQSGWQTATTLPGVDLSELSLSARRVVLSILRTESCTCGCALKIAECRINDTQCAYSRRLANFVVRDISSGKSAEAARADLSRFAKQPPSILDEPVKIAIAGDPMKGPSDARVTVVEFSDFQCPYCAKAVAEVNHVMERFPKDVRVVFKEFPLDSHSQAALAAEAALAAQAQGKFWEMHNLMYANFRAISRTHILGWANDLGLDMKTFIGDLDSHKFANRVRREEQQGEEAGVGGTPTFFINGRMLNAAFDVSTVAPLVAELLKH